MFTFSHRKDLLYPGWKSCICLTYPSTPTDSTCRFFFALHTTYLTQRHIKKHSGWRACQELMLKGYLQYSVLVWTKVQLLYFMSWEWELTEFLHLKHFVLSTSKLSKSTVKSSRILNQVFYSIDFFLPNLVGKWFGTQHGLVMVFLVHLFLSTFQLSAMSSLLFQSKL